MTDPQGMAKLEPKGTVGTIQNIDIYKIYIMGLIEKIFKVFFSHYKFMRATDH